MNFGMFINVISDTNSIQHCRKYLLYSLFIVILFTLCSCDKHEFDNGLDNESLKKDTRPRISVPCTFVISPFNSGADTLDVNTKAEDYKSNEYIIKDFWLLQFNSSTGDFIGATWHPLNTVSGETNLASSYVKMVENTALQTVWIVANTGNSTLFASYGKTLTEFLQDGYEFNDISALNGGATYMADPSKGLTIPLSGSCEFDPVKNNLEVTLKSIVAKLTISYSIDNLGYKLNAIKLFRVPSKISYAPASVTPTTYALLTYEYLVINPVTNSGNVTLYIPQNRQQATVGKNGSLGNNNDSPKTKTENAPAKATYFSLSITKNSTLENASVNIFPGGDTDSDPNTITSADNAYSNYDILANTHYTEKVSVNAGSIDKYFADDNNDSRLMEIRKQTITSNCYIINPILSSGQKETVDLYQSQYREECYALPVVHRVNEAWSIGNSAKVLKATDEWMMHVVWQDQPERLVYFAESSGLKAWRNKEEEIIYHMGTSADNTNYASEYYGRGIEDNGFVYIYAKRSSSTSEYTRGNVLIALRKKDANGSYIAENGEKYGEILWSWHLWVTDYNPDEVISKPGTYTGIVRGNSENGNNSNRRSRVFHYGFWSGSYDYEWIMDRNLGAKDWMPSGMAEDNGKDGTEGFGLFYQWGRKDPFSGGNPAAIVKGNTNFGATAELNNGSDVVADPNNNLYLTGKVNNVALLTLYDIYGRAKSGLDNAFEVESNDLPSNIWETIDTPYKIFNNSSSKDYLPNGHSYSGNNWNNPNGYTPLDINTKTKTLFDPCPVGWEVPSYKVYSGENNEDGFVKTTLSEATSNVLVGDNYYVEAYSNHESSTIENGIRSWIINVAPGGTNNDSYNCTYFPRSGWIGAWGQRDLRGLCDLWTVESKTGQPTLGTYLFCGHPLSGDVKTFVQPVIHVNLDDTASKNWSAYFAKKYAFGVRCVKRKSN